MENQFTVCRVLQRKDGVKMVIVPKKVKEIQKDDYVRLTKIKEVKYGK